MAAGMLLRRPSGETIIDSDYKTLALVGKIPVGITAGTTASIYTLNVSGENALVACYCTALEFSVYTASHSGSSATINFLFRGPGGTTSETVMFYVFANPTLGADTFGIKIFDGAGSVVFSNFSNPIRIAGVVSGNSGFSGTGGRIYAPIMLTRYDDVTFNNGVIWNIRYCFLQSSGSSINSNMRVMRTGPIRRASTSGSYLAADVTNY